jgi:hypothetical protein
VPIGTRRANAIYHFDTSIDADLPLRQKPDPDELEELVELPEVGEPDKSTAAEASEKNKEETALDIAAPTPVSPAAATDEQVVETKSVATVVEPADEPDVEDMNGSDAPPDEKPEVIEKEAGPPASANVDKPPPEPGSPTGPSASAPEIPTEPAPVQPSEPKGGSQ